MSKLYRAANAVAHLAEAQRILGVDDASFSRWLVDQAVALDPEALCPADEEDEEPEHFSVN